MQKPLLGQKIAVLVANGFNEKDLTLTHKALISAGADVRIISMDNGLVNSWNENGWGLNFAADGALNEALAVDYTMLVVPGGERSVGKLKLTAHTKRFVNGFINARKPIAFFADAVCLLAFAGKAEGVTVAGAQAARAELVEAGAQWSEASIEEAEYIISGIADEENRGDFISAVIAFFVKCAEKEREAMAA